MGFGLLLLLVAAVVATGATGSAVQKRAMQQVVEVNVAKVRLLSDMLDANNQMMVVRREMLIRQGDGLAEDEARIGPHPGRRAGRCQWLEPGAQRWRGL